MRRSAAVQAPLPASVDDALCNASSKKKSVVIITTIREVWSCLLFNSSKHLDVVFFNHPKSNDGARLVLLKVFMWK
jgi:hypothetical protein